MSRAFALTLLLFAGAALLLVAGVLAPPLSRTCAAELDEAVCAATVRAALGRGLPTVHPLILAAHVEPGAEPGPQDLGHRATVSFDLLGVPGSTHVRLFTDQGGHWGGVRDRGDVELAAWSVLPLALSVVASAVISARRSRRAGDAGGP